MKNIFIYWLKIWGELFEIFTSKCVVIAFTLGYIKTKNTASIMAEKFRNDEILNQIPRAPGHIEQILMNWPFIFLQANLPFI